MNAQKMTQKSLEALQAAQSLAVEYENQALCPEHLFCALLSQQDGLIPQLFQKMGAEPGNLAAAFAKKVGELPHVTGTGRDPEKVYITPELDRALTAAEKSAAAMKDEYVSVEHLVLGMMDAPNAAVKEVLRQFSLDKTRFLEVLAQVRGNQRVTSDNPESTYDVLAKYGQDLVELARQQKLDPVIGRDAEIRNVIRILSRKTKNNPVLIGEPGVGKTAIAEGLAQRIAAGQVPFKLRDKEVYLLDLTALVAGTQFRGQFEQRMKGLIDEVKKLCTRTGGFVSHFGTSSSDAVHKMAEEGNKKAIRVWDGMKYQIVKYIGAMAAVLGGRVDGILLTGGLLRFEDITQTIREQCEWIAPVSTYPGEVEHEALAAGALRVLRGEEEPKHYTGRPVWDGWHDEE